MNIEHRIAKTLINEALKRGWTLTVNDGEETVLWHSTDAKAIWRAMHSTEEEYLHFYDKDQKRIGWVWLVYGNGEDLITDHVDNDAMRQLVATTAHIVETI